MQKIFGGALGILGISLLLASPVYFGIAFIFFAFNIFSTTGFEMNLENKTYRTVNSIFRLSFGKWKHYPEIEYISVFKTKESKSSEGTSSRIIKDVITFNLYYTDNKYLTFYKTYCLEDANEAMERLQRNLNIDIFNKTLN